MTADPIEDYGLTEKDWQSINEAQQGTPPNVEEWRIYFRKTRDEKERQANQPRE